MKKLTNEEFQERIKSTDKDICTDEMYVDSRTTMDFYCSKGHHWHNTANHAMRGHGCPFCYGNKPIIGQTDLATTRPDVAALLVNPKRGQELMEFSKSQEEFICPMCHMISPHRVADVSNIGFSCKFCSDGISYGNKFVRNMLTQINIEYIPEYIIDGYRKFYDFYLPCLNMIIEVDGIQHFTGWSDNQKDLIYQVENDKQKEQIAKEYGITIYVHIDCRESNVEFLKNSILQSELNEMLDLSKVDWNKCNIMSQKSILFDVVELHNCGKSNAEISEILKISNSTVGRYLKNAQSINLYIEPLKQYKIRVILLNTLEMFDSYASAARGYNLCSGDVVKKCCDNIIKYAGIHPSTKEPLVWRRLDEYNPHEVIDFVSLYNFCTAKLKKITIQND